MESCHGTAGGATTREESPAGALASRKASRDASTVTAPYVARSDEHLRVHAAHRGPYHSALRRAVKAVYTPVRRCIANLRRPAAPYLDDEGRPSYWVVETSPCDRPASTPTPPPRTPEEIVELRRRVEQRDWFHTIDLGDGVVTPGCDSSPYKLPFLEIPERLDGMEVLDVGAYDGFFSFEAERRGAKRVLATDSHCWSYVPDPKHMANKAGFDLCREALNSRVEDQLITVEELSPETVGTFDLVLLLGVIYHTQDPIKYLQIARSLCRRMLILETHTDALNDPRPAAVFYPDFTLNNDSTNIWGPNPKAVVAMLEKAGFREVKHMHTYRMCTVRSTYHAFV